MEPIGLIVHPLPHRHGRRSASHRPACRKDTSCRCDMCLASIAATDDIVRTSLRGSPSASSRKEEGKKRKRKKLGFRGAFVRLVVIGLGLFLAVEAGFLSTFSGDLVRSVGERSLVEEDMSGRLRSLQAGLKGLAILAASRGKFFTCGHLDSNWNIVQDGGLVRYRCVLYKSWVEEVSIWVANCRSAQNWVFFDVVHCVIRKSYPVYR